MSREHNPGSMPKETLLTEPKASSSDMSEGTCLTQAPIVHRCWVLQQYVISMLRICIGSCLIGVHVLTASSKPDNQSINIFNVLGGQLGPNRQEVQFSELIQTRFASYMQSIP